MNHSQNFKKLFAGFESTATLWKGNDVCNIEQFQIQNLKQDYIPENKYNSFRLGKIVERFVSFQLQNEPDINIVEENVIIRDRKLTIGEIDLVIKNDNKSIHLEVVYKFYLYDSLKTYNNPLEHWIGPNRNDSLIQKLEKLKKKQFPLLFNSLTVPFLKQHNLNIEEIEQQVYFKAQLFIPYNSKKIDIKPLNENCISGFYITYKEFILFKKMQFYIPCKLDWLISAHPKVNWINYSDVKTEIEVLISKNRSPLIWIKDNDNFIKKCFVTWW